MSILDESQIIRSWKINAVPWIKAISDQKIDGGSFVPNKPVAVIC
jgi:hypothetical protein